MDSISLKFFLVGDQKVGITSFRHLLTKNSEEHFFLDRAPIVYSTQQQKNTYYKDPLIINSQFWELINSCKFYFKDRTFDVFWLGTAGVILVFNLNKLETLNFLDEIIEDIKDQIIIAHRHLSEFIFPSAILIGNLYDLAKEDELDLISDKVKILEQKISQIFYKSKRSIPFIKFSCVSEFGLENFNLELKNIVRQNENKIKKEK